MLLQYSYIYINVVHDAVVNGLLAQVDQPMLAASVEQFYEGIGFHSTIAGLPQLQYHIEEERLQILEDEMTEKDLELDSKTQRGVKALCEA